MIESDFLKNKTSHLTFVGCWQGYPCLLRNLCQGYGILITLYKELFYQNTLVTLNNTKFMFTVVIIVLFCFVLFFTNDVCNTRVLDILIKVKYGTHEVCCWKTSLYRLFAMNVSNIIPVELSGKSFICTSTMCLYRKTIKLLFLAFLAKKTE